MSNEKVLPLGKIPDKTAQEQPRQRRVITGSCAYSKHKARGVSAPQQSGWDPCCPGSRQGPPQSSQAFWEGGEVGVLGHL